jgi:hypothetical protein
MKLIALLGAAIVAATPAHASTPAYAHAYALRFCAYQLTGMTSRDAARRAMNEIWPVHSADIIRDGAERAARYIAAERLILCGELK